MWINIYVITIISWKLKLIKLESRFQDFSCLFLIWYKIESCQWIQLTYNAWNFKHFTAVNQPTVSPQIAFENLEKKGSIFDYFFFLSRCSWRNLLLNLFRNRLIYVAFSLNFTMTPPSLSIYKRLIFRRE